MTSVAKEIELRGDTAWASVDSVGADAVTAFGSVFDLVPVVVDPARLSSATQVSVE
jgi:hypothetical protein